MSKVECDRRILKAFYTQYVAVLLIVLTFSISAYQRASMQGTLPKSVALLSAPSDVQLAELSIDGLFADDGQLRMDQPRLEAVASLLKNHDVNATLALAAERVALSGTGHELVRKLHDIEQFMLARGVPREAFVLRVLLQGDRTGNLTVTFSRAGEGAA